MISKTGNKTPVGSSLNANKRKSHANSRKYLRLFSFDSRSFALNNLAFTFIEMMMAILFLSVAIVAIFRVFIYSLDRLDYLSVRLYAHLLLDNHMALIERDLRANNRLPLKLNNLDRVNIDQKTINFNENLKISELADVNDTFALELSMKWTQQGKEFTLTRSSYITDFGHWAK